MVYRGTVHGGVVVLDDGQVLPDGTQVRVSPLQEAARPTGSPRTLATKLLDLAGSAGPGLPSDLARNHDHYLRGTPKR